MSTMTQTRAEVERFGGTVWEPTDLVEVRCIPADRTSGKSASSIYTRASGLPDLCERMEALNADGLGIYAGVLPRRAEDGRTDADCLAGHVVWADLDSVDPRTAWKQIVNAGLPKPTMIASSGHGTHAYWRLTEPAEPDALSEIVHDLAVLLGSDRTVRNPSRVMRLPGFTNWKAPVAKSKLEYIGEDRYSFDDLRATIPYRRTEGAAHTTGAATDRTVERARKYIAAIPPVGSGERNAEGYRVAAVLRNDFGLHESDAWGLLCAWNSRNAPPLDDKELRTVFDSAGRHAGHPRGCKAREDRPEADAVEIVGTDDLDQLRAELKAQSAGEREAIPLPWDRLSRMTNALRPGTIAVLAGPPGVGKSFFAAHIALGVHRAEVPWQYLPLEDRGQDLLMRFLGILAGDYRMIETDVEGAARRQQQLDRFAGTLEEIALHVCENPRVGRRDAEGRMVVPELTAGSVLNFLRRAFCKESTRVVIVDPLAQVDFEGREPWRAESDFVRKALGIVGESGGTLLLVVHSIKRPGKHGTLPLTLDDVQGAANIGRLVHTVLLLDAHDPKIATVHRPGRLVEEVTHNRTLLIGKARNGDGTRQRIAFTQSDIAPAFEEHGVICPGRPKGSGASSEHWSDR